MRNLSHIILSDDALPLASCATLRNTRDMSTTAKAQPTTSGTWNRIGRKQYRHISGVEVRYNHNRWVWVIFGGAQDGNAYGTLNVAQHFATN